MGCENPARKYVEKEVKYKSGNKNGETACRGGTRYSPQGDDFADAGSEWIGETEFLMKAVSE